MKVRGGILLVALVVLASVRCSESTDPVSQDFEWSGTIAQGDAIEIKGVNGSIIASAATGNTVMVSAAKEGQQDDPANVEIDVVTHAGGVTICAVYPDVPGQPLNECAPGNQGHLSTRDNDVDVTFTVSVPAGVEFVGTTVNGSVSGTNLQSNAFATTVNGDVTITTTQLATATTVNGPVTVAIGLADWDRDLVFSSVNGDVTVEVPSGTNAEVRLATANGSISSDFTLTQAGPGDVRGTIGSGGWFLRLATANGNVALERGP
jgi:DUF4097 and DUF4098 domain-containing protein YvlB